LLSCRLFGDRGDLLVRRESPLALMLSAVDILPASGMRWLSTSNYELAFRDQVILLDAYFDQGARNRPTGVVPSEVKKTDAILIGRLKGALH
jgi:hypothetical protein